MTHADDRVYVYIERYRPELMIWAKTPRNIEHEVMAENPHINIVASNYRSRSQVSLQPPSFQPPSLQQPSLQQSSLQQPSLQPPSASQKPSSSEQSSESQITSQNALVVQDSGDDHSEVDSR